jgi:3'(2'), 5'-bisphosphate nucleotidase
MASHHYLVEVLKDLLPETPVISEESHDHANPSSASQFWLVDPLDGTKEFLKGTDEFTVNIGLIKDNYPIAGVVHAPALNLTYFAASNEGAWRQTGDQPPIPLRVRAANPAQLALVASKDHAGPLVQRLIANFPGATLRSMGSSLKFCLVAEGSADLYLRDLPTMEWDTAAAQCVVESAGGFLSGLDGVRLRYGKTGLKNPAVLTLGDHSLVPSVLRLCAAS